MFSCKKAYQLKHFNFSAPTGIHLLQKFSCGFSTNLLKTNHPKSFHSERDTQVLCKMNFCYTIPVKLITNWFLNNEINFLLGCSGKARDFNGYLTSISLVTLVGMLYHQALSKTENLTVTSYIPPAPV